MQGVVQTQTNQAPCMLQIGGEGRIAVINADRLMDVLALATTRIEQLEREFEQLKASFAPPPTT